MTVFVLITVELPSWCHYPHISLPVAVMSHLIASLLSATARLDVSMGGHGRTSCHLHSGALPWAQWGSLTEMPGPTWVFPSQLPASLSKPCFPYSEQSHYPPLKISLNSPFLWPRPLGWGHLLGVRNARKILWSWELLVGPSIPGSSNGHCKHTARGDTFPWDHPQGNGIVCTAVAPQAAAKGRECSAIKWGLNCMLYHKMSGKLIPVIGCLHISQKVEECYVHKVRETFMHTHCSGISTAQWVWWENYVNVSLVSLCFPLLSSRYLCL